MNITPVIDFFTLDFFLINFRRHLSQLFHKNSAQVQSVGGGGGPKE